jgi:magnesium-transporting ATPase (P-type)
MEIRAGGDFGAGGGNLGGLHAPVLDGRLWADVVQTGLVIASVTLLTMDMYLPGGIIDGSNDLVTARTAGFTVLVLTSLFTCLTAHSDTTSAFVGSSWLPPCSLRYQ